MCGIFGYFGEEQDVSTLVHERLRHLEYRGYDSWGLATARAGKVWSFKRTGKMTSRTPDPVWGCMALGHTRWATTGVVSMVNAHPHSDGSGEVAVVHNGIVENYVELRAKLLAQGHRFLSETDTEVIAHLIEEELKLDGASLPKALRAVSLKLSGLNAIAAMNTKTGELAATKKGSPLYVGVGAKGTYLASDISAFSSLVEQVVRLKDGELAEMQVDGIKLSAIETGLAIPLAFEAMPPGFESTALGSYAHYLEKEITEQSALLRKASTKETLTLASVRAAVEGSPECVITGCGSAYHAALIGSYLAAGTRRIRAFYPHELEHFQATFRPDELLLCLSQSGETIDILHALHVARAQQMKTAALVNVPTSTLAAEVDFCSPLDAGPEISVLSTKAFTAMLAQLALVLCTSPAKTRESFREASDAIHFMLQAEYRQSIRSLAKNLKDAKSLFVIGAGICYPLALEGALKIKEVSYIHAEGFASAELKHGVISLIEQNTPCIALVPPNADRTRVAAEQLKARGAKLIGIGESHDLFDRHFQVQTASPLAFALAASVPMQLLAYELALVKNLDPDKPRNLAKSVTVR